MKKIGIFLLILGLVFLPISVKASEKYNTLDFEATLADEELEHEYEEYKPSSDAITIYLFRGKGCGYCRAFLSFLNSITDEYGKYFKLESYEVWNDQANSTLLGEVSEYMGEAAGGVPYIVIGDKVFPGYAAQYDKGIKEAIKTLYDTKKSKRYDVFNEMKKNPKKGSTSDNVGTNSVIIWSFVFMVFSLIVVISYVDLKFKQLNNKIDSLNESQNGDYHKVDKKPATNKKSK